MSVGPTRTVLLVMGMRDNAARERVVEVLEAVCGVTDVDVNLHRGRATVSHGPGCGLGDLVGAVLRAGYAAAPGEACGENLSLPRGAACAIRSNPSMEIQP